MAPVSICTQQAIIDTIPKKKKNTFCISNKFAIKDFQ